MSWQPHVPALEELESLGNDVLQAMDTVEINRRIDAIANQIARSYATREENSYEGCVDLISATLSVTGNGMGGRVGTHMVAKSQEAAVTAAHEVYRNDFQGDL